jgi:hypothetical protein
LEADLASNSISTADYTAVIPADTNSAPPDSSPGGYGYILIAKNPTTTKLTGALADGTIFSQSVPCSSDGSLPVYANLYSGKGLVLGWLNLASSSTNTNHSFGLTWICPDRKTGLLNYRDGFTNTLLPSQLMISQWTNPPENLNELTNISLNSFVGATNSITNIPISTTIVGESAKIAGESVTGTIALKTGGFKVTIGTGVSKTVGFGAIVPNHITKSGGYFLTQSNAQAIQFDH